MRDTQGRQRGESEKNFGEEMHREETEKGDKEVTKKEKHSEFEGCD